MHCEVKKRRDECNQKFQHFPDHPKGQPSCTSTLDSLELNTQGIGELRFMVLLPDWHM